MIKLKETIKIVISSPDFPAEEKLKIISYILDSDEAAVEAVLSAYKNSEKSVIGTIKPVPQNGTTP